MNSDVFNFLVAHNIKKWRLARDLSQSDLASLSGLSRNTISNIESGIYCLRFYNAYSIANALDIDISLLFEDSRMEASYYG